jgi:hypothetical protein
MRTAMTESVSLCTADEKLTAFLELELAIRCSGLLGGLQESRRVFRPCA